MVPPDISELRSISSSPKNMSSLTEYLDKRRLNPFPSIGYIRNFIFRDTAIQDSLLFFNEDIMGELDLIQTRSVEGKKEFRNIYQVKDSTHMYYRNVEREVIVITESVLDSETVVQTFPEVGSISTIGVSCSTAKQYFLAFLTMYKKVFLAFDNDEAGARGKKDLLRFFKHFFEKEVSILDFPCKDLNDCLVKKGSGFLRSYLGPQLFS